jgi:hypothetical protein
MLIGSCSSRAGVGLGAFAVGLEPALAGDLGVRCGRLADHTLSRSLCGGIGIDLVALGTARHRHVQALAAALVVGHRDAHRDGLPFDRMPGLRVPEVAVVLCIRPKDCERRRPGAFSPDFVGPDDPGDGQAVLADGVDAEQVSVGQGAAWLACVELVGVLPGDDQIADVGPGAFSQACGIARLELAPVEQVALDAAGQIEALAMLERSQGHIGPGEVLGQVGPARLLGHLFVAAAVQPPVRVVVGQRGDLTGADRQRRAAFPVTAETHRLGELGIAQLAGKHRHAAPGLHRAELGVILGDHELGAGPGSVPDDRGQVGHGGGAGLIQDDQRIRAKTRRAAGLAPAREMAQELGGVLRHRDPGLNQDVPPGAGRRDPEYLTLASRAPRIRDAHRGVGLASPGRSDDQLGAARTGQRQERGRRLVQAQPAARGPSRRGRARVQLCL